MPLVPPVPVPTPAPVDVKTGRRGPDVDGREGGASLVGVDAQQPYQCYQGNVSSTAIIQYGEKDLSIPSCSHIIPSQTCRELASY